MLSINKLSHLLTLALAVPIDYPYSFSIVAVVIFTLLLRIS